MLRNATREKLAPFLAAWSAELDAAHTRLTAEMAVRGLVADGKEGPEEPVVFVRQTGAGGDGEEALLQVLVDTDAERESLPGRVAELSAWAADPIAEKLVLAIYGGPDRPDLVGYALAYAVPDPVVALVVLLPSVRAGGKLYHAVMLTLLASLPPGNVTFYGRPTIRAMSGSTPSGVDRSVAGTPLVISAAIRPVRGTTSG